MLPSSLEVAAPVGTSHRTRIGESSGTPTDVVDIGRVLSAGRRHWRRIALGVAIVLGASVAYLRLAVPRYEATTTVLIDSRSSKLPSIYAEQTARDEVFTEIEVMRGRTIAADVVDAQALQVEADCAARLPRPPAFIPVSAESPEQPGSPRRSAK